MNHEKGIARNLIAAAKESGRSPIALLLEIARLRFSIGRLGVSEYFDFRLYHNDLSLTEKMTFGGWRTQKVLEDILVDDYARFLSLDKITMYKLLTAYGIPIPRLKAVYRSQRPSSLLTISSPEELAKYLKTEGVLPVYFKPSLGSYGRGNTLVQGIHGDNLVLGNGAIVSIDTFCNSLDDGHSLGWVLQEPLSSHPDIAKICGNKISGVRIHSFLSSDKPTLTKAIWKINIGLEDSDNFRHGTSGNLLAAVDMQTGKITRSVSGIGRDQKINSRHPVSGEPLIGFTIPLWEQVKSLICDAQLSFPGYLCPGWDIAICADGPKLLEVNFMGDIDLSQHSHRRGFLDSEFIRLMNGCGLEELLKGPSLAWQQSSRNGRYGRRRRHWVW
jgi:hypothetical protein